MSVGPSLAGSSLTFVYAVCKDLFVYIKHKRKRVRDLVKDLEELRKEVNGLHARWNDINVEVERRSWFIEKSEEYIAVEDKLSMFDRNFEEIEQKHTRYREILGIQNHSPQAAEASNEANVHQPITNAPAQESASPSSVEQQKIWTKKFFKLAQLDKDIVKLTPKIISFKHELQLENMTRWMKPKRAVKMKADELENVVPSHDKHLADLKKYLGPESCKRIGIYGAPGVGKTNIMKNLNNCFVSSTPSDCNLELDYVIWVDVPRKPTKEEMIENIQRKIMQRLKIDWQKNNSLNDADIISTALSEKKYLLLLDDFSSLIKLEEIGIHEDHKNGKVVIAAKQQKDLKNVELDELAIQVNYLSLEESEKLFNKFVQMDTLNIVQRDMIVPILRQLGGIPAVIRLTAEYLNEHREQQMWDAIKQRLQSDVSISELVGLGGIVEAFKLSYENLEEDSFKKCLLYAALFPNEHKILRSTLVECWKAEQFLSCRLPTMKATRVEGALVFSHLERSCLLQSCHSECVKMPAFFRKIARFIPFPGEGDGTSIIRLGPEIDGHQLEEREWNVAIRVSMMESKLGNLPSSPQCDCLSTLLLQLNPNLTFIPDPFFRSMKALRVLDLHRTGIKLLPPSISNLRALRCLYLKNCSELIELPREIGDLEQLEVLDIQGTSILCLRKEISSLINLRCLRISFDPEACNPISESRWRVLLNFTASTKRPTWLIFPPGVADKLEKLEELTIALGGTGPSKEILNRVRREVREGIKVVFIDPCTQRPFQSLDQENLIQSGEGTNLPHPILTENPRHDLTTAIQSPRSDNEGPSNLQSRSTRGRTDSNYQARKKDKGKGIAIPKLKNKAIPELKNKANSVGIKIKELPQTNACPLEIQEEYNIPNQQIEIQEEYNIPNQQIERALGDDVDRPNSSAGASTSRIAGRSI